MTDLLTAGRYKFSMRRNSDKYKIQETENVDDDVIPKNTDNFT